MGIPKISIIIPVYNVEEYIGLTLDSILNQTLKEIEIILIDDGSTDNSRYIIEDYSKKYNNIRLIYQENSGPSIARNRGIQAATGEYITFADSDDILPENSLELRYEAAIKQNADLVIGATYKFNSKKKWPLKSHFVGEGKKDIKINKEILWTVGPWNKIYKAELIKNLKFPEKLKYAEDQVFVIQAYLNAKNIYAINNVIYYYRVRESETNNSLTQQRNINASNVIKQIYDSWNLTCKNIDENIKDKEISNNIKINYLDRLSRADIWPSFKSAIISKDRKNQANAFSYSIDLIKSLDKDILNKQSKFIFIFTKDLIDKYLFIDKNNKYYVLELMTTLFSKLEKETISNLFENNQKLLKAIEKSIENKKLNYITRFLAKRKIEKTINKNINKICTKGAFKIGNMLPIKKHNVILATNRNYELEGNLKFISNELKKHNEFSEITYLKKDKTSNLDLIKMYYNFARAKFIILDDYYRQLYGYDFRKETEIIQVWHACGAFKKFGFSAIGQGDSNSLSFEEKSHKHYTKVITSSKEINKHYAEAFNIDESKVLNLGVPRTDAILDSKYRKFIKLKLEKEYKQLRGKKIITYAPTFRGGPKERKNFKCEFDYTRMIDELGDDYVIILKLHPIVDEESVIIPDEYKDKVLNLTSYKEINDILISTDILITDYSSVVFEFALLDRPIILFAYDLDSYLDERNFYYDYKSFVPGPIVYNNDEMIDMIKNNSFDLEKIKVFKNKFFDHVDGKSTKRMVEYLVKESQ